MTKEKLLWFQEVVDRARQGDKVAKGVLLVVLETERKPTIIWKLFKGDVRPPDFGDGHHDVLLRVGERIEQLRSTPAYFKWEERIIHDVCKKYRGDYRSPEQPLEIIITEIEGNY